ncbi:MAG TPA: hypothetical protein VK653_18105 [Xanthobacteraceae bacterium]|nr:hypothetical protein [Xanthobacteraceae bacterium]
MKKLFTLVALAVAAFSVIGTQAFAQSGATKKVRPVVHAQSNKKGYGAYALIPNNYYTVPSSLGPADRFGEASQR